MKPRSKPSGRRFKGFERTSTLVEKTIRDAGQSRGFSVARVLTHWAEIAGPRIAEISTPIKITYGRGGLGATLTVLTTGSQAPMLEMQKEGLREKVNACYGYAAIRRIRITQTAATGFAEGAPVFGHAPREPRSDHPPPPPAEARALTAPVADPGLRAALERLGAHVMGQPKS